MLIAEMEHLTEDEFQEIYHKHITNTLYDAASVIPKSCHQHVMRSLTPMFSLNPKIGVEKCSGCQFYIKNPSTAFPF